MTRKVHTAALLLSALSLLLFAAGCNNAPGSATVSGSGGATAPSGGGVPPEEQKIPPKVEAQAKQRAADLAKIYAQSRAGAPNGAH